MTTRRLTVILAALAMVMATMAPAALASNNAEEKRAHGWVCNDQVNNRLHCASVDILDWIANPDPGKALNVLVFDDTGDVFLGTEILRIDNDGNLVAEHHWHGGIDPDA